MAAHTSLQEHVGVASQPDFNAAASVEQGIPTNSLNFLRQKGLTFSEMANVISPRTLKHRNAKGENLSSVETERAIRVASTIALAEKVFGESTKAMAWLRGKDDRLNDRTPLSMLHTDTGTRVVQAMLWGIDEGVYS